MLTLVLKLLDLGIIYGSYEDLKNLKATISNKVRTMPYLCSILFKISLVTVMKNVPVKRTEED